MKRCALYPVLALALSAFAAWACGSGIILTPEASPHLPGGPAATSATGRTTATPGATVRPPVLDTPGTGTATPPPVSEATAPPPVSWVEERIVEVEWPASMRVGDGDVIRLSLIPVTGGYVAQPEIEGHKVEPTVIPLPMARPGYTGYAVASLSAAGIEVEEATAREQLLVPGQKNVWRWAISPERKGTYRIVVGLSVRWVPEAGSGLPGPFEEPVWNRTLTVEARATLGLSGSQTDWVGFGGTLMGTVASLPLTKKVLNALWKRLSRAAKGRGQATKGGEAGEER